MNITIFPSQLSGNIQASASKSSMQRACAAALLRKGETHLFNPGHSNDDKAALSIIQNLGAKVTVEPERVIIQSQGVQPTAPEINCGESGLSIRMFTPIAALSNQLVTVAGSGSLMQRPMDFFDEVLPQLGVTVNSHLGKLPLQITGPLQPVDITVDGTLSSQFLTGLLMAYSVSPIPGPTVTISVNNLKSTPYISLTLDVMAQFGLNVPENENFEKFIFSGKKSNPPEGILQYTVEGDWSGAAFLLVAGAIAGPIKVHGLSMYSTQADKAIIDALLQANANIAFDAKDITVHPGNLMAFNFDATHCPDLFPPLVTLAAYCYGVTTITGVSRLQHKESNRGITLQEQFGKMGVKIELDGDEMRVFGGNNLTGAEVHSCHDHRIAMACAIAALKADGSVKIEAAEAVNKSYPDFYRHIKMLGTKTDRDLSALADFIFTD